MATIIDSIRLCAKTSTPTSHSLYLHPENAKEYLTDAFKCIIGADKVDEPTLKRIHLVARWLVGDIENAKPSLRLIGAKGLGKTTLAKAIEAVYRGVKQHRMDELRHKAYNRTAEEEREYRIWEMTPIPIIAPAMQIVEFYEKSHEEYKKLQRASILIIDDLGVEPMKLNLYGSERFPLIELLNYRYDKRATMKTIITTNLDSSAIAEIYGDRTEDRLREMCNKIAFSGESYRR